MAQELGERAWLFVMKSDGERSWAANRGYDDSAGFYYSYDSNVAYCRQIEVGDIVVVRSDDFVAGWGIAEHVDIELDVAKEIMRCPSCRRTNHYYRSTVVPHYRCSSCRAEFEEVDAIRTTELVTGFRCWYACTWTEAARPVQFRELADFYATTDTFNAIRPLRIDRLTELLDRVSARDISIAMDYPRTAMSQIVGGHSMAIIRRRRGQREFRFRLMDRYGEACAITGPQPPQVLEAAHLYSFAERPEHKDDGGLLLRRDFHALFDANLIAINPGDWRVEVAPRLRRFDTYRRIDRSPLRLEEQLRPNGGLIADHYEQSMRVFQHN
jgi:hypothetical protein